MARTSDPNSATSQFFINVADNSFLDWGQAPRGDGNGYCVFGKVVGGMDVVEDRQDAHRATPTIHDVTAAPIVIESPAPLSPPRLGSARSELQALFISDLHLTAERAGGERALHRVPGGQSAPPGALHPGRLLRVLDRRRRPRRAVPCRGRRPACGISDAACSCISCTATATS